MMPSISFTPLTNLGSAVPWGLWVSMYVMLIGISTGSFLLMCWSRLTKTDPLKAIRRHILLLALCALGAGLACIIIDLGHIERSYALFIALNPLSPMSWMGKLYPLYALVLIVLILRKNSAFSKPAALLGVAASLVLIVTESLLFTLPPGKAWHSAIVPVHFLTAACASAVFALMLAILWTGGEPGKNVIMSSFSKTAMLVVTAHIIVEIVEILFSGGAIHPVHWAGTGITLLALIIYSRSSHMMEASVMGLFGMGMAKFSSIVSAQVHEPLAGYAAAYAEPRMMFMYAPSGFEWLAMILILAGSAAALYFLNKLLPFAREN